MSFFEAFLKSISLSRVQLPKSAITIRSPLNRMFSTFKSRWQIDFSCRWLTPKQICLMMLTMSGSDNLQFGNFCIKSTKLPSQSSDRMNSSSTCATILSKLGWSRDSQISISRLVVSSDCCCVICLSAYFFELSSSARNTYANAPSDIFLIAVTLSYSVNFTVSLFSLFNPNIFFILIYLK